MIRLVAAATSLLTVACAANPTGDVPTHGPGSCDAGRTQALVGRPASSGLAAEAQKLSGAGIVRWLQPGQIVTMEYREDRLNLVLDEANKVTAIRCG